MDTVGDEAWKSVRLAWGEELWIPAGAPVAAVAYALWIGLSGAAVSFLADAVTGGLTIDPWTGLTDLVVLTFALFWVIGPAAVATLLVRDRVTNVRGNLATGYRLRHPILLFLPPVAVLGAGLFALARLEAAPWPVLAVLVVGAVWFLVRTLAYAYRVFALSLPIVGHAIVFVASVLVAVAALVLGADAIGRADLAEAVAVGLAARTGIDGFAALPGGSLELLGVGLPAVVGALVVVPVGLATAYVAVQLFVSAVVRLVKPTVRRPELRTGQRYPAFARPTTDASPSSPPTRGNATPAGGGGTDSGTASRQSAAASEAGEATADEAEEGEPDVVTDVSHTRVYSPPDDADAIDPASVAGPDAPDGGRCPACGAVLESEPADGTCPDCGADL